MSLGMKAAAGAVRAAAAVSPRWGGAVALPLFRHVARPRPVGAAAQATMWKAERSTVRIAGLAAGATEVVVYEWGQGDRVVVLAHGWNGRASQFAVLVRELTAAGYRVVAFDAPAHGDSAGRATYLIDWVDILLQLQRRHGGLHAVVGHSFGGLAALVAVTDGVKVDRVVTIAAPVDADMLLEQFQAMLGFDDGTAADLRRRFAARYFPDEADPFARLSAERRPLSSGVPLLIVHDDGDRVVPFAAFGRLAGAHPQAQVLPTQGFGHNRVLESDDVLDAVVAFLAVAQNSRDSAPDAEPTPAAARPREVVTMPAARESARAARPAIGVPRG